MSQESFISSICPESTHQRIFTKYRANVSLVNVVNHDKFCDKLFKDFDFAGVKISGFPVRKWRRRYSSDALYTTQPVRSGKHIAIGLVVVDTFTENYRDQNWRILFASAIIAADYY